MASWLKENLYQESLSTPGPASAGVDPNLTTVCAGDKAYTGTVYNYPKTSSVTGGNKADSYYENTAIPYPPTGDDKNTPTSLKQLRWSIYELLENHEATYGKCMRILLQQSVEELFKEYTNS